MVKECNLIFKSWITFHILKLRNGNSKIRDHWQDHWNMPSFGGGGGLRAWFWLSWFVGLFLKKLKQLYPPVGRTVFCSEDRDIVQAHIVAPRWQRIMLVKCQWTIFTLFIWTVQIWGGMVAVVPLTTFCETLELSHLYCHHLFDTPVYFLKVCSPETVWNDVIDKQ